MRALMRLGLATLFAATTMTATGVVQADAAEQLYCGADRLCMWEDVWYQGSRYVDRAGYQGSWDLDWWNGDNEITSVENNTNYWLVMWDNDNFTGFLGCVAPGQAIPELYRNDEMESYTMRSYC